MKKIVYLGMLFASCALFAQDGIPGVVILKEEGLREEKLLKDVRIEVDISENDIESYGLKKASLENEIASRLHKAQISVKNESKLPKFILRIETKPAFDTIAIMVQLSFMESATLERNKNNSFAISWDEAALLTSKKADVVKDVTESVDQMVDHFIKEFLQHATVKQ